MAAGQGRADTTMPVAACPVSRGATNGPDAYTGEGGRSQTLTGRRTRPEPYEDITDRTVLLLRLVLLALTLIVYGGPL